MTMENIIITGAAGGIGVATVKALAAENRCLICVDIDEARLKSALSSTLPGKILHVENRLETPAACRKVVERFDGHCHGLVHLAGIMERDEDINADPAQWDRVINANLRNAYELSGEVIKKLDPNAPAKFVFASSLAFRRGAPENVAYSVSKAGLVGLIRSLARRLGPRANVNGIAPGIIKTAMPADLISRESARLLSGIALERFGEPEDVASVIAFLTSPASNYITGQVLNIDGGMAFS